LSDADSRAGVDKATTTSTKANTTSLSRIGRIAISQTTGQPHGSL